MPRKETPTQAVKHFCRNCCGGILSEVKKCGGDKEILGGQFENCMLFPYRFGKGRVSVKTIRKHCLMCMGGSKSGVRECPSEECALWKFRFGTNPNYKKKGRNQRSKIAVKKNLSKIGLESRAKNKK
jgi:hypothetical protein